MKLLLTTPGIKSQDRKSIERHLHHVLPHIKKRLGRLAKDTLILRAKVSIDGKTDERPIYHITLSTQLPDHSVIVHKDGFDMHKLVQEAEVAFKKELRRCVAKIRKDYLHRKRKAQRTLFEDFTENYNTSDSLRESSIIQANQKEDQDAHPIFARLRPILSHLHSYAVEHIRAAISANELSADYIAPDDLVDQAILSMIETDKNLMSDPVILERALFQQIDVILEQEIENHKRDSDSAISLDDRAPTDEQWGVIGPEAEEKEYHKPYEALKIEDILEDHEVAMPSRHMTDKEEHRAILKCLSSFHKKARSAFFLHKIEGFELFEIAMIQNRDEAEVTKDIEDCVEYLKTNWSLVEDTVEAAKAV